MFLIQTKPSEVTAIIFIKKLNIIKAITAAKKQELNSVQEQG